MKNINQMAVAAMKAYVGDDELIDHGKSAIRAIILSEFLEMELPARVNILNPWMPKAGLCMVYAKRGLGKTHFALEVTMAVSYGTKFLSFEALKPCRVLYIDGEMPANTMQERLAVIKRRMPPNPDMIEPYIITPDLQSDFMPDLSTTEGQEKIRVYTDQAELIIVDNISTLVGSGKENEAESWLPLQRWALRLRQQGKSVLFVHHAGKNGSQRGTSKREDVLDTVINLKYPSDYEPSMGACFELHFEKARSMMGDDVMPLRCQLTDDGWHYEIISQSNYKQVVDLYIDGRKQIDISKELDISKAQVSKLVKKGKTEGVIR